MAVFAEKKDKHDPEKDKHDPEHEARGHDAGRASTRDSVTPFALTQSQTPTYKGHDGRSIKYTPTQNVFAGDVLVLGTIVAVAPLDIPANTPGWVDVVGAVTGPKDASAVSGPGVVIYWNPTGNPTVGTAGSGCFTTTSSGGTLAGIAELPQLTGDPTVTVLLGRH